MSEQCVSFSYNKKNNQFYQQLYFGRTVRIAQIFYLILVKYYWYLYNVKYCKKNCKANTLNKIKEKNHFFLDKKNGLNIFILILTASQILYECFFFVQRFEYILRRLQIPISFYYNKLATHIQCEMRVWSAFCDSHCVLHSVFLSFFLSVVSLLSADICIKM